MVIVFPQSTLLPSTKAHWIQILNTAHALARQPGVEVWLFPTSLGAPPAEVLRQAGLESLPTLRIAPMVPWWLFQWKEMKTDVFDEDAPSWARAVVRWNIGRALARAKAVGGPAVLFTREQEVFHTLRPLLEKHRALAVNEHHRFTYVRRVERGMEQKKKGYRTLGEIKRSAQKIFKTELKNLRSFDGIICTTQPLMDRFDDLGFPVPRIWLPNGANLDLHKPAAELVKQDIDLLYIGQLYRWKNVDLLVEALPKLDGTRLTIVGGNDPEDLARIKGLAERHRVLDRIEFIGQVPHADVGNYMARAKVGVIPLPRKGFPEARLYCCPLKALEMMAAGTPMVASDLPAQRGLLIDNETAVLVKPDDADALAQGIRRLLDDAALRQRLADHGKTFIRQFTYEERAKRIVTFIRELHENRRKTNETVY